MKKKLINFAILYDGTHFAVNRKKWAESGCGHLLFSGFHEWLQTPFKEVGKLVYAGWHQGILVEYDFTSDDDLKQGTQHSQLLCEVEAAHVTIHWKSLKRSISSMGFSYTKERQVDVALTVDAMRLFYDQKIKTFLLVTSDMDYVPLVSFLIEKRCTVIVAGFNLGGYASLNPTLKSAATKTWDLETELRHEIQNPALFQR